MDWGQIAKRLSLGIAAIFVTGSILLLSDLESRRKSDLKAPTKVHRVALLQHVSTEILDDGARGVIAGLAEADFFDGGNLSFKKFNAEQDLATSTAISQGIVNGNYHLALTLSTPSLQSLANVNKAGRVPHLFAMVTDPIAAGVGISGLKPSDHPPHLAGIATLQPVAESIALARKLNPGLRKLGVVWNPGEVNSQVTTTLCRAVCKKVGIELLEANAENTSAVREATDSLIARGVEALWVGGDVTVLTAIDAMIGPARRAQIPVFTCIPGNAPKGALFDLGANYFEVGRRLGTIAGQVLSGTSTATLPIEPIVPPKLFVNLTALSGLKGTWKFPDDIVAAADVVIDEKGQHEKAKSDKASESSPKRRHTPLARQMRVRILEYVNIPDVLEAEQGVLDGLRDGGLQADRDFKHTVQNALGDMAMLPTMVDDAVASNTDLLITLSTPTLQTALRRAQAKPIVFTFLADPVAAGAGKSDSDHLPNVAGAYGSGDAPGMVALIKKLMPKARRVGILFCPTEINSVYNKNQFEAAAAKENLEVIALGVDTPAEVAETTTALCSKSIDLVCLPTANLTASSFSSILLGTRKERLPVFAFLGGLADQGAAVALARDYYDMEHSAGLIAARVLRGEPPARIPFDRAKVNRLIVNPEAARQSGLELPPDFVKSAQKVIER